MIFHLFTLLFVILKVLDYIAWSWWLVFLPSMLGVAFAIGALILVAIAAWFAAKVK